MRKCDQRKAEVGDMGWGEGGFSSLRFFSSLPPPPSQQRDQD
jgi:hypothetical protein